MTLKVHIEDFSEYIVSASVYIAWESYFHNILCDVYAYTHRVQKINGEGNRECQEKYVCIYILYE